MKLNGVNAQEIFLEIWEDYSYRNTSRNSYRFFTRRTWIKLGIPMNVYICAKVKYSDRNREVGMAYSLW